MLLQFGVCRGKCSNITQGVPADGERWHLIMAPHNRHANVAPTLWMPNVRAFGLGWVAITTKHPTIITKIDKALAAVRLDRLAIASAGTNSSSFSRLNSPSTLSIVQMQPLDGFQLPLCNTVMWHLFLHLNKNMASRPTFEFQCACGFSSLQSVHSSLSLQMPMLCTGVHLLGFFHFKAARRLTIAINKQ